MPKKLTVVVSQGQSANPAKRALEEDLVAALLLEPGLEVTVVPHLYDLQPEGTGMLCLEGIQGDMVVASWLYPRAAHWILDRNGIRGRVGTTLLKVDQDEDEDDEAEIDDVEGQADADAEETNGDDRDAPSRFIYCLDLRARGDLAPFVEEIQRIAAETSLETVDILGFVNGDPKPEQMARFLNPGPGNVDGAPAAPQADGTASHEPIRIVEEAPRRWYPVIDFSRCTNCLECLDFCLFGVYGVDNVDTILVEQPDNCRKGCPACSRVCPENAIIFPQHKTPAIAGAAEQMAGGLKIDLSKLFGAPEGVDTAVAERDEQLLLAGRQAVGATVGVPKRQEGKPQEPKDELDDLMDELDAAEL